MILALLVLTVFHAWYDAHLIAQGTRVYHGWEGLAFAGLCSILLFWFPWYWVASLAIMTRAAFFDIALNIFRGKDWLYNGAGGSVIDRIENKLGIPIIVIRIFTLIVYGGLLFAYYKL